MISILPASLLLLLLMLVAAEAQPVVWRARHRDTWGNTDMFSSPLLRSSGPRQSRPPEETYEQRPVAVWVLAARQTAPGRTDGEGSCAVEPALQVAVRLHPGFREAVLGAPFG